MTIDYSKETHPDENNPIIGLTPGFFRKLHALPAEEKRCVEYMLAAMTPHRRTREQYITGEIALSGGDINAIKSLEDKGLIRKYTSLVKQDPADFGGYELTEKFLG